MIKFGPPVDIIFKGSDSAAANATWAVPVPFVYSPDGLRPELIRVITSKVHTYFITLKLAMA